MESGGDIITVYTIFIPRSLVISLSNYSLFCVFCDDLQEEFQKMLYLIVVAFKVHQKP